MYLSFLVGIILLNLRAKNRHDSPTPRNFVTKLFITGTVAHLMTSAHESTVTIENVVDELTQELAAAGILDSRVDAELLVCHVLQLSRGEVAAQIVLDRTMSPDDVVRVREFGRRRAAREPLQHITGHAYFRSLVLAVGPGVFVPRPETELLTQMVIDHVRTMADPEPLVVDLCAGSGAIALSVATEVPYARVVAVEKSEDAHAWTARNVAALAPDNTTLVLGDLADAVPEFNGRVAVVVSNPPYIPDDAVPRDPEVRLFDPQLALYGGPDGLDVVRILDATAARLLRPGGLLAFEHGEFQGPDIAALLRGNGWRAVATHKDLLGRDRYTTAVR
jgi:release factor glutamine methyltransferase